MKAANRLEALNMLVELYNVYSKLIERKVILDKIKFNDYTIVFDGILSESLKDSIQPILDKNNMMAKETKDSVTIYSLQ